MPISPEITSMMRVSFFCTVIICTVLCSGEGGPTAGACTRASPRRASVSTRRPGENVLLRTPLESGCVPVAAFIAQLHPGRCQPFVGAHVRGCQGAGRHAGGSRGV